jgi:Calcineurin-like phosphoesterase
LPKSEVSARDPRAGFPVMLSPLPRLAALVLVVTSAVSPARAGDSTCRFTNVERVVAVGDVHGAYDRFVEILQAAKVIDERQRWIGGRTHLVQLGDIVDRGPDSLKALDLLDSLQRDAQRAGGAVHALLGNHEVMRMLGDLRYTTPGEYAGFTSSRSAEVRDTYVEREKAGNAPTAPPPPLGFVEMRVAFGQNGRYGKVLRTHDAVIQIDGVLFVHGGISPAVAELPCDVINETVHKNLTNDLDQTRAKPLSQLVTRVDGPLWYRGLAEEPDASEPAVVDTLAKQKASAIVVGHSVTADGRVRVRYGGKVIQIDTGMQPAYVPNGRASALQIEHGTMTAIYADRRDVLSGETAAPAASAAPGR